MAQEVQEVRHRSRPRSSAAVSHDVILDTVYDILQQKSVRDLTIEEVARQAGVGRPTIYKWWPSKAALVMDMFEERIVDKLAVPAAASAEQAIRTLGRELIRRLNGFFGKVATGIFAEGQSEPDALREFRERYQAKRRAFTLESISRAKPKDEFHKDVDP